jgi:hypothetical protein
VNALLKRAVPILLGVAAIVFVADLASQLWMAHDVMNGIRSGSYEGPAPGLVSVLGVIAGALYRAAFPFFGACLLDRIDRWLLGRGASR